MMNYVGCVMPTKLHLEKYSRKLNKTGKYSVKINYVGSVILTKMRLE